MDMIYKLMNNIQALNIKSRANIKFKMQELIRIKKRKIIIIIIIIIIKIKKIINTININSKKLTKV